MRVGPIAHLCDIVRVLHTPLVNQRLVAQHPIGIIQAVIIREGVKVAGIEFLQFLFQNGLSIDHVVGFALNTHEHIHLALFAAQIGQERDRALRVLTVLADESRHPAVHRAGEDQRIILGAVHRAVYRNVDRIGIVATCQNAVGLLHIGVLAQHTEILAIVGLFLDLIIRVDKEIDIDQTFLVSLAEHFQPFNVFRVGCTVVDLAVHLIRNGKEVLQHLAHAIGRGRLGIERCDGHAVIFLIVLMQSAQRIQETFRRGHVGAAHFLVQILAHKERLHSGSLPGFCHRTGGIGIIGDAIHVAVVLGVPLDHIAIHDIIEVRIILVGQLVQRIDITLLIQ